MHHAKPRLINLRLGGKNGEQNIGCLQKNPSRDMEKKSWKNIKTGENIKGTEKACDEKREVCEN